MLIGLPEKYPSTCELPFNHKSLEQDFQPASPDRDPQGPGVWLVLKGQSIVTVCGDAVPELPDTEQAPFVTEKPPLYIGNWQGRPCRMLILSKDCKISQRFKEHSLHARNPQLPISMLSLAGVGLMIHHWESSSQFCGYCGSRLTRRTNDWGKTCGHCSNHHFPRIHPCVIGLIVRGDEILLVRKPEWVDGRYGLVAGFVEFGESLEEAMIREIAEETAIQVDNVRYIGSQSWPFPSQIMNGFVVDYVSGEIKLQEDELEAAAWYRLDQLPTIPPRRSIARYLIDRAGEFLQR